VLLRSFPTGWVGLGDGLTVIFIVAVGVVVGIGVAVFVGDSVKVGEGIRDVSFLTTERCINTFPPKNNADTTRITPKNIFIRSVYWQ